MRDSSDWNDVEKHIEHHEGGCWTWDGSPIDGDVYRFFSEMSGGLHPDLSGKIYRMPDCTVGRKCINPSHIGTIDDYWRTLDGQRQDIPEPPSKAGTVTAQDKKFLKSLNISWE